MKITSMLSNGYLQPFRKIMRVAEDERASSEEKHEVNEVNKSDKETSAFSHGVSSVKAGLLFERLHGENRTGEGRVVSVTEELLSAMPDPKAKETYDRYASIHGLWTLKRGFESASTIVITLKPGFETAA